MRLLYRASAFGFLVFLLYMGSGWAKELVFDAKEYMRLESTKMEMSNLRDQLVWSLTYSSTDLRSFEKFLNKTYPRHVEDMMYDGWDNEYWYEFSVTTGIFYLCSAGPDGYWETEDDLVVTNDEEW